MRGRCGWTRSVVVAVLSAAAFWSSDAHADVEVDETPPTASFPPAGAPPPAAELAPAAPAPAPTAAAPPPAAPPPAAPPPAYYYPEDEPEDLKPKRRWYGWQTLIVDGVTLGGMAGVLYLNDGGAATDAIAAVGLGAFAIGTPIIHFGRGHLGKGLGSLAIRGGCGAVVVVGRSTDMAPQMLAAAAMGLIAAIPIDAAILAREDIRPDRSARRGVQFASLRVAPTVDPVGGRYGLAAMGTF